MLALLGVDHGRLAKPRILGRPEGDHKFDDDNAALSTSRSWEDGSTVLA